MDHIHHTYHFDFNHAKVLVRILGMFVRLPGGTSSGFRGDSSGCEGEMRQDYGSLRQASRGVLLKGWYFGPPGLRMLS